MAGRTRIASYRQRRVPGERIVREVNVEIGTKLLPRRRLGNAIPNPEQPAIVDRRLGCGAGKSNSVVSATVVGHRRGVTVVGHSAPVVYVGPHDFVVACQRYAVVRQVKADLEVDPVHNEIEVADRFDRLQRVVCRS